MARCPDFRFLLLAWSFVTTLNLCQYQNSVAAAATAPAGSGESVPQIIESSHCTQVRNDGELNSCIATIVQRLRPRFAGGIPEIGLPPLDPFHFEKFDFEQGSGGDGSLDGGGGPVAIQASFTNISIQHLTNFQGMEFVVNSRARQLSFHSAIPNVRIDGNYTLDGRILYMSLGGTGPYWMELDALNIVGSSNLSIVHDPVTGQEITQGQQIQIDLEIGGLRLELENLFDGNPFLGPVVNHVLNANSLELYEEIKPQFTKSLATIVQSIANGIIKEFAFLTAAIKQSSSSSISSSKE